MFMCNYEEVPRFSTQQLYFNNSTHEKFQEQARDVLLMEATSEEDQRYFQALNI